MLILFSILVGLMVGSIVSLLVATITSAPAEWVSISGLIAALLVYVVVRSGPLL